MTIENGFVFPVFVKMNIYQDTTLLGVIGTNQLAVIDILVQVLVLTLLVQLLLRVLIYFSL